jgi:hypothetical protein
VIEAGVSLLVEARHILAPGNNPQEIVELADFAPRHPGQNFAVAADGAM